MNAKPSSTSFRATRCPALKYAAPAVCEKSAGHALEWASAGGARVVYWYFDAHLPLFLFGVDAKAEKADLTAEERIELQKLVRILKAKARS